MLASPSKRRSLQNLRRRPAKPALGRGRVQRAIRRAYSMPAARARSDYSARNASGSSHTITR
jgi:hypothetical protein